MPHKTKMNFLVLVLFIANAYGVKIGVSKMSTTTTTTLSPPSTFSVNIDTTQPLISTMATTTIDLEVTTDNIATSDYTPISTTTDVDVEPQFPPKITNDLTKVTTSKPTITISTTPSTLSATIAPTVATENTTAVSTLITNVQAASKNLYCSCNLLPAACDINCCCDTDCSKDILKVFNCFKPSKYPEFRLHLEDFEYEHGLPSCKINDGWLCVFRTNTRPTPDKVFHFDFDTSHQYKWPTSMLQMAESGSDKEKDFYKFGEPIKLFNTETLEISDFELPYAYKPPFCQLTEAIKHLKPVERNCLQSPSTTFADTVRKFQNLAATTKLLSRPKTQITDLIDHKQFMLNIFLRNCTFDAKTLSNDCHDFETNNNTQFHDMDKYFISEIRITILHNFTDLHACSIELINQALETNKSSQTLWQKFNVQYIIYNSTHQIKEMHNTLATNRKQQYSGPLGYLLGEPVIVAKFVANNESEEITSHNRVLNYFKQSETENNTINLFTRRTGLCDKIYEKSFNLNFDISSLHECTFYMDNSSLGRLKTRPKNFNLTEICTQFQNQILMQLFDVHANEINELYVSSLGRPENSSDKWVPLQVQNLEFAPIVGELSGDNSNLICRNVLLSAAYEFHIGRFTERGIAQQALIKNAVLKLGQRHDLEFTLDEKLEVPLTLTVMFYDLSFNDARSKVRGCGASGLISIIIVLFRFNSF